MLVIVHGTGTAKEEEELRIKEPRLIQTLRPIIRAFHNSEPLLGGVSLIWISIARSYVICNNGNFFVGFLSTA